MPGDDSDAEVRGDRDGKSARDGFERGDVPRGEGRPDRGEADPDETAADAAYRVLSERLDDVADALRDLERELREATQPDGEQLRLQRQLSEDVARLRKAAEYLVSGGRRQAPGTAVAVTAQAPAIRGEVGVARRRWGRAWDPVWRAVKSALRRLWVLISQLLHVKDWTVAGQVRSDPFGLASASVTITFGAEQLP